MSDAIRSMSCRTLPMCLVFSFAFRAPRRSSQGTHQFVMGNSEYIRLTFEDFSNFKDYMMCARKLPLHDACFRTVDDSFLISIIFNNISMIVMILQTHESYVEAG